MKKGVILEIKSKHLVMLTPEGEFIKGKKTENTYDIGEEIYFETDERKLARRSKYTLLSCASALVAIFIIGLMLLNPFEKDSAYAYVTMDMNPSIEFVLDKNFHVIRTNAYNEIGEKVLTSTKFDKDQSFANVAKTIMDTCITMGYIKQKQNIVIASIINKEEQSKDDLLDQKIQEVQTAAKKIEAKIEVVKGSIKERKTAREKGISPGKFIVEKKRKNKSIDDQNSIKKETQIKKIENGIKITPNKHTNKKIDNLPATNMSASPIKKTKKENHSKRLNNVDYKRKNREKINNRKKDIHSDLKKDYSHKDYKKSHRKHREKYKKGKHNPHHNAKDRHKPRNKHKDKIERSNHKHHIHGKNHKNKE